MIGLGVIIPEVEVYQGVDSAIALGFYKDVGSSGHSGPMEDTSVHFLVDPCLVFGHQCLWFFESRVFKSFVGSMRLILCIILCSGGSS